MGWLFDVLMLRELMKNNNMQQVGESDTLFTNSNGGTVKVYDGEDQCFKAYLNVCRANYKELICFPKVIDDEKFNSPQFKKARIVRFEKLTPVTTPHPQDFYDKLNEYVPILIALHKKTTQSTKEKLQEMATFGEQYPNEVNAIFKAISKLNFFRTPCAFKITPNSFMMRGSTYVLVNPFSV